MIRNGPAMQILVIEDDEVDFIQIKRTILKAFPDSDININWISHPDEVNLQHEIDAHDVCLIDQNMGSVSGVEVIRASADHGSFTPIILLTGDDNQEIDVKAAEFGASDYLVKSELTPTLLNRSIRFSVVQKEHARKLADFAYIDGLTGLANRTKFDQALELAINVTERAKSFLALFILDLDDFKIINDTYGHPAGDAVLKEVADRISATVRKTDTVARLGGDEFGVVLNGYTQQDDIRLLIEKILSVFTKPVQVESLRFHFKCSIGIALLSPEDIDRSAVELIRAADGALYKAKTDGKNSYAFFDPEIGEALKAIGETENDLARSIERGELELYFQPKVKANDHTISGAEALLRWNRANAENLGPSDFIPIAERSLSILKIGRWVIEETCRAQRQLIDANIAPVPVAINISPIQLRSETFADHVLATLKRFDLAPYLIEFEITETVLMQQYTHIVDHIVTLASAGCTWAIEDFGVGYSSLSLLKNIPISKIKLDKSFVQQIEASDSSRTICNIVALLAHELDLVLVAEGVEHKSQFDLLTLLAKDELQGFYFSHPLPFEDYRSMLTSKKTQIMRITDLKVG